MEQEKYVMYILVNSDLPMKAGKISAQVGHVVGMVVDELVRMEYTKSPIPHCVVDYHKWQNTGHAKIVLRATAADMEIIMKLDPQFSWRCVYDEGRTQIPANSLTAIAFFPSCKLEKTMERFKLL